VSAVCVLLLAACEQPPFKEVAAAEAALAVARKADAQRFATDRYHEAQVALEAAREKLERKDYRGALSAASDAAERSKEAVQAAEAAKALVRNASETAKVEAQEMLASIDAIRDEARRAKVPARVFASLQVEREKAVRGIKELSESIDRGQLAEAQERAVALRTRITPLPGRYREALDKWLAAHRTRRPIKPAPPEP
jgi:uncharacterized protein involved in type VI secretion and phage assembly